MSGVSLRGVKKSFGLHQVIKSADIEIGLGQFVVFVGPSGCGKSTLLRLIAGLETVSGGKILIEGSDVTYVEPSRRGVSMVFQSYALYPHLSVFDNMGFGLSVAGRPKSEIRARVHAAAETLQLTEYLDRRPSQLSGGQRQRVAIGRAIVREPKVFLFDEPLSNLDAELRVQMRMEIARLHKEIGATMIFVTHDQVEAMTLADRIVVLKDGEVMQVGAPLELYDDPENHFVAGFIGSPRMNFFKMKVLSCRGALAVLAPTAMPEILIEHRFLTPPKVGVEFIAGVRPENIQIGNKGGLSIPVVPQYTEELGGVSYAYVEGPNGISLTVERRSSRATPRDEAFVAHIPEDALMFFNGDGQRVR